MKKYRLFTAIALVCLPTKAFALGITVSPGDYTIDNIKIGQAYDLSKMSKPLSVHYRGGQQMDVSVSAVPPSMPKDGYEVIPDTSWVILNRNIAPALPGEVVEFNPVIAVPNDERYLGKKYDVRLNCALVPIQGPGTMGVVPGAQVRILFTVSGATAAPGEMEKLNEIMQRTRNISVNPAEIFLERVPLGKRIDIKREYKKSLKISNVNDDALRLKISCQPGEKAGLKIPGYDAVPDPSIMKISKDSLKLRENQIDELFLYLNMPDKPEYRGKKFLFIVDVEVDGELLKTRFRSRITVNTGP